MGHLGWHAQDVPKGLFQRLYDPDLASTSPASFGDENPLCTNTLNVIHKCGMLMGSINTSVGNIHLVVPSEQLHQRVPYQ